MYYLFITWSEIIAADLTNVHLLNQSTLPEVKHVFNLKNRFGDIMLYFGCGQAVWKSCSDMLLTSFMSSPSRVLKLYCDVTVLFIITTFVISVVIVLNLVISEFSLTAKLRGDNTY